MSKLLISHCDLDGLGSIVLQRAYADVIPFDEVVLMNYGLEELPDTRPLLDRFDEIVIADLSFTRPFYEQLIKDGKKVRIFDHHVDKKRHTTDWIAEYRGNVLDDNRCGTKIFYEEYLLPRLKRVNRTTEQFVELVHTYDMWQINSPLWQAALSLNRVMFSWADYGDRTITTHERFIKVEARKILEAPSWYWNDAERISIEQSREIEDKVYRQAKKDIQIRLDRRGKKFGLLPMRSKISLTASNLLQNDHADLDYIVVVNTFEEHPYKLSFRSARGFDCTLLGPSGGHEAAAGGEVTEEITRALLKEDVCLVYKDDPEWDPQREVDAMMNSDVTTQMTGEQRDAYVAMLRKDHPVLREHALVPAKPL